MAGKKINKQIACRMAKHDVKTRFNKEIKGFGANLKKVRIAKGYTLERLAYEAGVAYTSIYKIENGTLNCTIGSLFAISKALKVPPKTLMDF